MRLPLSKAASRVRRHLSGGAFRKRTASRVSQPKPTTTARRWNPRLVLPFLYVRVGPQGDLHDHRLEPSIVHLVHVLCGVPPVGEKRLYGCRDRVDEGDDVAQRDVVRRIVSPVGLVLLGAGVTEGGLVVVVEPLLVIRTPAGVENPLAEPLA